MRVERTDRRQMPSDRSKNFTAEPAKTAKAHGISKSRRDASVWNIPDHVPHIYLPDLEISRESLRALRPLRFDCFVWDQSTMART